MKGRLILANSIRDDMVQRELRKFLREHPSVTFLDIREEALCWTEEEEEKPGRIPHDSASREVVAECNLSTATSNPLQQVLDVLPKPQKSIEDMVKAMSHFSTVEQNRAEHQHLRNQAKPNHIAHYCHTGPDDE